jgi:hypothetical protein
MSRRGKFARVGSGVLAMTVLMIFCVAAWPQNPPPPRGGRFRGGPGPFGDDALTFMGFEGRLGNKTVTSAPFTAKLSAQTTESFADGNKIQHSTTGFIARDSQGRTRQEVTLSAIGPWATSGMKHGIFVNDPVASMHYILEPDQKMAISMPSLPARGKGGNGNAPPPPKFQARNNQSNTTTMSLGVQTVGGVSAEGTLITRTIPAGEIGNLNPIQITVERWYSSDLQMNVLIKRSDPRMGATIFQLSDIQRQEPDASLFQVPSDYTLKQGRTMGFEGTRPGTRPNGPPPPPPQ